MGASEHAEDTNAYFCVLIACSICRALRINIEGASGGWPLRSSPNPIWGQLHVPGRGSHR